MHSTHHDEQADEYSSLLTYDCVSFNKYLDTILAAHQPPPGSNRQNQSPWLFLDAANTIFETAKRRVYAGKAVDGEVAEGIARLPSTLSPILEEQPKWALLAEVLDEIERDAYFNPGLRDDSNGTVLIMCTDRGTCAQLREYLQNMQVVHLRRQRMKTIKMMSCLNLVPTSCFGESYVTT